MYSTLFAETSALDHFETSRDAIRRPLEQVIANAQTVENTFASWKEHSDEMKNLEEIQGGSCPIKSASRRTRGPIAIWRDAEAATAKSLHAEISASVAGLRTRYGLAKDKKAKNFVEVKALGQELNAAVEMAESLSRGAYIKTAKETLLRQLEAEIEWPKEKSFGLAALLEICVLFTGAIAARRGSVAAAGNPAAAVESWRERATSLPLWWQRAAAGIAVCVARGLVNVFYAVPRDEEEKSFRRAVQTGRVEIDADPDYPTRSIDWAMDLLPFWFPMHGGDYVILPNGRRPKAIQAVRAIEFQQAARQLSFETGYDALPIPIANQLQRLAPDARSVRYSVYKLHPNFAQALRIALLAGGKDSGSAT